MRTEDSRAFADFVSREQPGLLRLAVLLTGDRGHAEDLVQTALLKTYRHWRRVSAAGDAGRRPVSEYDLDGGVALVPAPPGAATVETVGADDGVRETYPLMGRVDLGRG